MSINAVRTCLMFVWDAVYGPTVELVRIYFPTQPLRLAVPPSAARGSVAGKEEMFMEVKGLPPQHRTCSVAGTNK
jgi:hypothetical protein